MASFSQVSVKHRAAEFEKSLFLINKKRTKTVDTEEQSTVAAICGAILDIFHYIPIFSLCKEYKYYSKLNEN